MAQAAVERNPPVHWYITQHFAHPTQEHAVNILLKLATAIDWLSKKFGLLASWAVLFAALICAISAFVRYGFNWSSNSLLEIQWYLFAYAVMAGAPYVLRLNEHVRVDLIYGKLKGNKPVYVDIFGLLVFLLPVITLLTVLSWEYFVNAFQSGEMSQNAGGLIRWPVILAMPVGFGLMFLQGWSEIIKRVAYLQGRFQMDTHYEKPLQ
jgi:TRAP-type mannitol/chloroaromatic compound transport system permease small subunit